MKSVYTVGELIQYAPGKIDPIIFNLLRTIVATSKIDIDVSLIRFFFKNNETFRRKYRLSIFLKLQATKLFQGVFVQPQF